MASNTNGKVVLDKSDFVEVIDAAGTITSVPEAWVKSGSRLLPPGTKKATDANIRAAKARKSADAGEGVDVDQLRADIEAGLHEEHAAVVAERDARIAELEQLLEAAAQGDDSKGDDGKGDQSKK